MDGSAGGAGGGERPRVRLPIGRRAQALSAPSAVRRSWVLDASALRARDDRVVVEEPLEIRLRGEPLVVTMRTPGHDAELAAGFVVSEGIARAQDVLRVEPWRDAAGAPLPNVVDVVLAPGVAPDLSRIERSFGASSACGLCGKTSLAAVRARTAPIARGEDDEGLSLEVLASLPARMRAAQRTFEETGGLHAAALFDREGSLVVLREDVGRHNATDAVLGHAVLTGRALAGHVLLVSGRAGFEIVQKAAVLRVPVLCSVSAATSLSIGVAEEQGVTLVAFLRPPRAVVYTHPHRIRASAS